MNTPMLPDFKRGQRLRARDLQSVKSAARVGANVQPARGVHTIQDRDGVHMRSVLTAPPVTTVGAFWGVVVDIAPTNGIVQVKRASGILGSLTPVSPDTPIITVWVGYETHFRAPSLGMYDEIFCMPCSGDVGYQYFGWANLPGLAYKDAEFGYSAIQDDPDLVTA